MCGLPSVPTLIILASFLFQIILVPSSSKQAIVKKYKIAYGTFSIGVHCQKQSSATKGIQHYTLVHRKHYFK